MDKDEIIGSLGLKSFGQKGWLRNEQECPYCHKKGKWGVKFGDESHHSFHCFICNKVTSLRNYLFKIGRADLAKNNFQIKEYDSPLASIYVQREADVEEEENVKSCELPYGLEPISEDEYLDDRGFLPCHYEEFEPCFTKSVLELKLHNYLIFKIKHGETIVGWLARSRYSKEWHEENLKESKRLGIPPQLRYKNSKDGFTGFLGGSNFIGDNTDTVIVVEGLFDKVNIDRLLGLKKNDNMAVVFTFGKSISKDQIAIIRRNSGVKNIILMYDEDALQASKDSAMVLNKHFNVYVARITDKGVDPGSMDGDYLTRILDNMQDPINFYTNNIKIDLK